MTDIVAFDAVIGIGTFDTVGPTTIFRGRLSCYGWTTNASSFHGLTADGAVETCNNSNRIECCAPPP